MLRDIKSPQRAMRMLSFRITGTGTAAIAEGGFDATLTDNGTGDYTLTFTNPFARLPTVVANVVTANCYVQIGTLAVGSVQLLVKDLDDDSAKDAVFHCLVMGPDVADAN